MKSCGSWAERLVSLDLLDNAATLLQHQIDHRLKGAQRATVAARLAIIYLMDRKPAAAAQALRSTRLPELPYHIKRARSLLEARALSDLSRTDLALDIVKAEQGPDVDRLTADIQWQGRRWRAAGETYERILGERWKEAARIVGHGACRCGAGCHCLRAGGRAALDGPAARQNMGR